MDGRSSRLVTSSPYWAPFFCDRACATRVERESRWSIALHPVIEEVRRDAKGHVDPMGFRPNPDRRSTYGAGFFFFAPFAMSSFATS